MARDGGFQTSAVHTGHGGGICVRAESRLLESKLLARIAFFCAETQQERDGWMDAGRRYLLPTDQAISTSEMVGWTPHGGT